MITRILLIWLLVAGVSALAVEPPAVHLPGGSSAEDVILPVGVVDTSQAELIAPDGEDPTVPLGAVDGASGISVSIAAGGGREGYSNTVKVMLLITLLSVAPGFLMMMTSFTRIVIVLGFVRKALGTQTLPPNQVLLGLSLFLTLFTMAPTIDRVNDEAIQPYLSEEVDDAAAMAAAGDAVRDFMARHTRRQDLALFISMRGGERPRTIADVPLSTLIPAFITSELKTAFQMGFIIFLPFLVIDIVVAGVLMALGMMMLPPVIVSLPFKVLLFVLVDGWALLVQSLAASYA